MKHSREVLVAVVTADDLAVYKYGYGLDKSQEYWWEDAQKDELCPLDMGTEYTVLGISVSDTGTKVTLEGYAEPVSLEHLHIVKRDMERRSREAYSSIDVATITAELSKTQGSLLEVWDILDTNRYKDFSNGLLSESVIGLDIPSIPINTLLCTSPFINELYI